MRLPFLGIVAAVAAIGSLSTAEANPTVVVGGVTIEGNVSGINPNVYEYFGIPYASAARWSPPKQHAPLSNPFDASRYTAAAVCPQPAPVVVFGNTLPQSEDCLSLTVHVPASATQTSKLPVLFWIHGGALQTGSGIEYFPENMVAVSNIIVVSINYRLGALGWLAQRALEAGKSDPFQTPGDAGNYGLMDQQFALQWVKKYIAAFGGDPGKVTIAGQSAGGLSVSLQLASTATAAGLFRAAIVESGAYAQHSLPPKSYYESKFGNPYVSAVLAATGEVGGINCNTLTINSPVAEIRKCLRGAALTTLLAAQQNLFGGFGISPVAGTLVVPNTQQQAFSTGEFLHLPVLQGIDENEGRFFEPFQVPFSANFSTVVAAGGPANYDLAHANGFCGGICSYVHEINLILSGLGIPPSENTQAFDNALASSDYPVAGFPDPYLSGSAPSADEALGQVGTDYNFACNALDSDAALAQFTSVYAYEFNDPLAPPVNAAPALSASPNDQYGYPTAAEHGAEMQFLFYFPYTTSLNAGEQSLETTMWSYWANFAKNLDPNKGDAVPAWPTFTGTQKVQALAPGYVGPFTSFGTEHYCSVWEPIIAAE